MVNPRHDKQGVRTPKDIERKYDLGGSEADVTALMKAVQSLSQSISQISQNLSTYITNTNARIFVLEDAILPQKSTVFCEIQGNTLESIGLSKDTLCVIDAITDTSGATSYEGLSSIGEYKIKLRVLGSDYIITLDITITVPANVTLGSKVYLTERSDTLCIAYAK